MANNFFAFSGDNMGLGEVVNDKAQKGLAGRFIDDRMVGADSEIRGKPR
jgi:hypothetical protein